MRAWHLTGSTLDSLKLVDVPEPTPGPGQVLVRMTAASLNYRDLMIARGTYRMGNKVPLVPLSDGAGQIEAVGSGVTAFHAGARVTSSFFAAWPDGPQTPEVSATALGGAIDGVLAEKVVFPVGGLLRTPAHLSDVESATLPCAALTAWNALFAGDDPLRPGQTVLVEGTGGVSIFGLQLAKLAGARVFVTSSSDQKLARARSLGADETINYRTTPEWHTRVLELTGGAGVDHVLEVGGVGTVDRAIAALAPGGQIYIIGGVSGFLTELPTAAFEAKGIRVRRIYVGSVAMFTAMNRALELHRVRPVVDRTFGFDELPAALEHLASGQHFGKIALSWGA